MPKTWMHFNARKKRQAEDDDDDDWKYCQQAPQMCKSSLKFPAAIHLCFQTNVFCSPDYDISPTLIYDISLIHFKL